MMDHNHIWPSLRWHVTFADVPKGHIYIYIYIYIYIVAYHFAHQKGIPCLLGACNHWLGC